MVTPVRSALVAATTVFVLRVGAQAPGAFDQFFTTATMRVDYFHTGGPGGEIAALDRVVADGPWPGSRTRLLDETNLGKYFFNEQHYGGGGVFNDQATAAADTGFASYVFVHEFGHHFAGLADEYYTSDVAYETGASAHPEPWEPNITALHDPARLKWKDLVEPGTSLPTPWNKEAFEKHSAEVQARRRALRATGASESEMDALFRDQQAWETTLLGSMKYSGKVGAFEGAGYEARGLYRPQADCIMFTRDEVGFCRVCQRAIARIIDLYSRP